MATAERRTFLTLDGLRAAGAFLVVMRHVPYLFGQISVPESFLAVDLFYLVSGFVVANAYRDRLAAGGFRLAFIKTRLIRLYPLYACGLILGIAAAAISVITDPGGWWTPTKLAVAILTGLVMIPFFPGLPANGSSLDGPTWTLLPELIANFAYAATVRRLNVRTLSLIIFVCGAGVVFATVHYKTLDVGFGPTQFWAALARVGFSFFAGVLIYHRFGHARQQHVLVSWALIVILTAILAWTPPKEMRPVYELAVVVLGFPILLILAGRFEPGPLSGRLFSFTGLISYGIYIIHQPVGNLVRFALGRGFDPPDDLGGLWYGAAFIGLLILIAWRLDRDVDAPVRKWLRQRFLEKTGS